MTNNLQCTINKTKDSATWNTKKTAGMNEGKQFLDTKLCDHVCQWLTTHWWFSADSSTNKINTIYIVDSYVKHNNPNNTIYVIFAGEGEV